jgi:DNA-binding NarL/FixJ family response regulator
MPKITVMLVDDHAVVRAGYRLLLSQTDHIEVLQEAERGEDACEIYPAIRPQVVVMDLNLPGIGGLAAIRRICIRDPDAKILACSIHDEPLFVQRALEAGARGYVTKGCPAELLVDAVMKIAGGETYIEPELAQRMVVQTMTGAVPSSALNLLTVREFDIFCLLVKGCTTREVSDELCLGYKTVSNYISLIKHKLNISTIAEMTRMAYQHGILKS